MSFYNEIDQGKAEWLRQLIARNIIAPGTVDERSICDFRACDIGDSVQCHFFAGIGVWSYALRLAGWPDSEPVWTLSCPCQPFSAAGKRKAQADERHLWPVAFRLITERRPVTIFGEQVADGDGQTWLDHVQADLESVGYRFGSLTLPAAGFGAPHGRHRTFFVADTGSTRTRRDCGASQCSKGEGKIQRSEDGPEQSGKFVSSGAARILGHTDEARSQGRGLHGATELGSGDNRQTTWERGVVGDLANAQSSGRQNGPKNERSEGTMDGEGTIRKRIVHERGPCNGFWSDAEWIPTRGEIPGTIKWRPIKPGTFPLAHGAAARVLRLRGYGDCIVAPVAAAFIQAYIETKGFTF